MPIRLKVLLVLLAAVGSFLLLPVIGLPYGKFDWTAYSHPYKQPTAPPLEARCGYTVQYGDTLFSIARRFGTSVTWMAQANSIRNIHHIFVGQRLFIPNCQQQRRCVRYTVRWGDTLASIARRFGVPVGAIVRQNGIRHPSRIFAGQPLRICPVGARLSPGSRPYPRPMFPGRRYYVP